MKQLLLLPLLMLSTAAASSDGAVARFVALAKAGSYAEALSLVDGDVEVNSDMIPEVGRTTPASRVLAHVAACRVSPFPSEDRGNAYSLWWNCGTEVNAQGVRMRRMAAVDIWPAGDKVKLRNFLVGRFPDTDPRLQDDR